MSFFAGLLEAAAEVQLLLDTDGRIVHVGGCPEFVMGYARSTIEKQPVLAAIPADQRAGFANAFQQVRSGVVQPLFAMNWPNPWQGRFEAGVQLNALVEDGKLLGVMMKAVELSSRYAFEAFLRNDAPTSLGHAKKSPMAMFFLDARGQCTFMNDRWAELTGQSAKDALGFGFLGAVSPDDRNRFKQVAGQSHQRKEGWRLVFDLQLPNGAKRRVDAAGAPLVGPDGNVVAYICAFTPFSTALNQPSEQNHPAPAQTAQGALSAAQAPVAQAPIAQAPIAQAPQAPTPQAAPEAAADVVREPHEQQHQHPGIAMLQPTAAQPSATTDQGSAAWGAPAIKEGFTDASLLAPAKKNQTVDPEPPLTEPGLDKVTGLANRLLFAQHVASTVSRMQSDALTVSISFVDLHGLAPLRETIGPRGTNDYLFLLSKRLEATIRSIEIAGRIEGDVVAVLSINWLFADDLPVVAQRLLNKLREPLAGKDGQPMVIEMSLGMAVAHPGEQVNDLFSRAWTALQHAKGAGEPGYEIDFGT